MFNRKIVIIIALMSTYTFINAAFAKHNSEKKPETSGIKKIKIKKPDIKIKAIKIQKKKVKEDWWERERKKLSERCRRESKYYVNAKLNSCEQKAPEAVKRVAEHVVALKQKLGDVLLKLADAYEKNQRNLIKTLNKQKANLYEQLEIAEKRKFFAMRMMDFDNALKRYPESKEIKDLKGKTEKLMNEYIEIIQKTAQLRREQSSIHKKLKKAERKLEFLIQKERLKKLQKELEQDNDIE